MIFFNKKNGFTKSNPETDGSEKSQHSKKFVEKVQQEKRSYKAFLYQEQKEREKIKNNQVIITNNINKDFQDFNDNIRNKMDISDKKIASFDQEVNSLLESNDIDALKNLINKTLE